ncbi:hypothetical protein LOC51_08600 [Rubrivivax sp. JA1024]|nr:hypothetical protein [Rubrivivax sp. JA1024]
MFTGISALRAAVELRSRDKSPRQDLKSKPHPAPAAPRRSSRSNEITPAQLRAFEAAEQAREDAALAEFFETYAGRAQAPDQPVVATAESILAAASKARGETVETQPRPTGMAAQVIRAGELRRDGSRLPAPTGLAAMIIAAGKKARGEVQAELTMPTDPTAAAIIAAGRKARGEK